MHEINIPEVHAEVSEAFHQYEQALVNNDITVLDALFWQSPFTLRYGAGEILYGYDAIQAFRARRSAQGLERTLSRTIITTFGQNFATANTLFHRAGAARPSIGRQSHTWARMAEGWRIVGAHVSLMNQPGQAEAGFVQQARGSRGPSAIGT